MTISFFGIPPKIETKWAIAIDNCNGKITIAIGKFLTIAIGNCNWVRITVAIARRIGKIQIRSRLVTEVFHYNTSQCHLAFAIRKLQLQLENF